MAEPANQDFLDALANIHADLAQLAVWLDPTTGLSVAKFPDAVVSALDNLSGAVSGELPLITAALAGGGELAAATRDALNRIGFAIESIPQAEWSQWFQVYTDSIIDYTPSLDYIGQMTGDGLNCICYALQKLSGNLEAGNLSMKLTGEIDWQRLIDAAGPLIERIMPRIYGAEPEHHSPGPSWLAGGLSDVIGAVFGKLGMATPDLAKGVIGMIEPLASQVEAAGLAVWNMIGPPALAGLGDNAAGLAGRIQSGLRQVSKGMVDHMLELAAAGPIAPDHTSERMIPSLVAASAAGFTAHMVSTVLSVDALACIDLDASGLAAMIGKFGGFDPAIDGIMGPFWNAYIKQPWTDYCNWKMMPAHPGVGQLLDWQSMGLFSDVPWHLGQPADFEKAMREHGYNKEWIRYFLEANKRNPRQGEMALMAESDEAFADDDWWSEKVHRAGYTATDGSYLIDGLKRKLARTYINAYVSELHAQVDLGLLAPEQMENELATRGFSPNSIEWIVARAELSYATADAKESIATIKAQYSRDQITVDELRNSLAALGLRDERVNRIALAAEITRYKKVPLLTEEAAAAECVAVYKAAYRAGLTTDDEYMGQMLAAGVPGNVADLQLAVDADARGRSVAAELRAYNLPNMRDQVVEGLTSPAAYRDWLVGMGFPDQLIEPEVELAGRLAKRHAQQRVESIDVPTYERALVLGLVDAAAVKRVLAEAGRTADQVIARMMLLTALAAAAYKDPATKAAKAAAGGKSLAAQIAAAEWSYVSGALDEAGLTAAYQKLGVDPAAANKRLAALRPLRKG